MEKTTSSPPWQLVMFQRSLKKQLKLKALLRFVQPDPGDRCLLVTCGDNNGALNWYFRAAGGQWTWADLQDENIEQMQALLGEEVHLGREDQLPFDTGSFDLVVSIDVLEHLHDDQPFLSELRRVLKPGGAAVVTVPNGDSRLLANKIKLAVGMRPEVYGHTRAGYSVAELDQAVSSAGLSVSGAGGYSRFFTEMIELVINFGFVFMLAKKRGGRSEGQIAPTKASELKTHGAAYKVYSALFPVLRQFSKLDALLPARTNNAVIVAGRKPNSVQANVLVTGAGGFIGSHLVDSQLAKGNRVRAVDLHEGALSHAVGHPNLEFVRGDILDQEQAAAWMQGIDVVYHLASAHLDVSLSNEHYRQVNVGGTLNLLDAACRAGVKRFVHCSSVGVMGDIDHPPAGEEYPCRPTNIYEQTKLEGEQAARRFGAENHFPVVIARPAWVYGSRCPRTAKLLRQVRKRRFPIFGNGENLRHPIYISDAVTGFELCAEAPGAVGETFIIAGERPVTINELLGEIAAAQQVPVPGMRLPMPLGLLAGYTLQSAFKLLGRKPPFSRRSLDFFLKHNAYDISKAQRILDFHPVVNLKTGLQLTLASK